MTLAEKIAAYNSILDVLYGIEEHPQEEQDNFWKSIEGSDNALTLEAIRAERDLNVAVVTRFFEEHGIDSIQFNAELEDETYYVDIKGYKHLPETS